MTRDSLRELILFELHDHYEQSQGAVQPSYTTWQKHHIDLAIDNAIGRVSSSLSAADKGAAMDTKVLCRVIASPCLELDLSGDCDEVEELLSIGDSKPVVLKDSRKARLFGGANAAVRTGAASFLLTEAPKVGDKVRFTCKKLSQEAILSKHSASVASYALFLLFASDTESTATGELAQLHYQAYRDALSIEVSK